MFFSWCFAFRTISSNIPDVFLLEVQECRLDECVRDLNSDLVRILPMYGEKVEDVDFRALVSACRVRMFSSVMAPVKMSGGRFDEYKVLEAMLRGAYEYDF